MSLVQDPATGTAANVAPANTAPTTAEAALVVSISPNCTITTTPTAPSDRIVSGPIGALNASVVISCAGLGNVGVTLTGSWSATLAFQGTIDGTNWFAVQAMPLPISPGSSTSSSTTTNAQFTAPVAGLNSFRLTATVYSSGTATVTLEGNETASTIAGIITVQQSTAANLQTSAAQGTPNTVANSWPTEITDGTHGPAAVKAASTAAVAADPALVVAVSPNNSVSTTAKVATTSSITSVAASTSSVSLLAANANRLAALITNDGTAVMFVALAATATTSAYTYRVSSNSQALIDGNWTGAISAIWSVANGNARITELTP